LLLLVSWSLHSISDALKSKVINKVLESVCWLLLSSLAPNILFGFIRWRIKVDELLILRLDSSCFGAITRGLLSSLLVDRLSMMLLRSLCNCWLLQKIIYGHVWGRFQSFICCWSSPRGCTMIVVSKIKCLVSVNLLMCMCRRLIPWMCSNRWLLLLMSSCWLRSLR
jgi:hypothetical protein